LKILWFLLHIVFAIAGCYQGIIITKVIGPENSGKGELIKAFLVSSAVPDKPEYNPNTQVAGTNLSFPGIECFGFSLSVCWGISSGISLRIDHWFWCSNVTAYSFLFRILGSFRGAMVQN
jgi:hypothetical protein